VAASGGARTGELSQAPFGICFLLAFAENIGDGNVEGEPGVHRQILSSNLTFNHLFASYSIRRVL
jgi:hypothetical protein